MIHKRVLFFSCCVVSSVVVVLKLLGPWCSCGCLLVFSISMGFVVVPRPPCFVQCDDMRTILSSFHVRF